MTAPNVTRAHRAELLSPKIEVVAEGYDLSLNRYKESKLAMKSQPPSPNKIVPKPEQIEDEIRAGLEELKGMVG